MNVLENYLRYLFETHILRPHSQCFGSTELKRHLETDY